jgi:hypothetical protein
MILNNLTLTINRKKNKIHLNQIKIKILKYNKKNFIILIILTKNKYKNL